jgi:hypothetical protein
MAAFVVVFSLGKHKLLPSCLHLFYHLWQYHFNLAPCVQQTPPFWACFVHSSWLHRFLFAPCVTQTPPLTTILVHPSWLHRFISNLAPCVQQTPPFTTWLVHPSSQTFTRHFCAMCDTNSSLHEKVGTSLVSALLLLSSMRDTHSSLNSSISTPCMATSLYLGTMCFAYSTLFGYVGTPLAPWIPRFPSGYTGDTSPDAAAFWMTWFSSLLSLFHHRLLGGDWYYDTFVW